MSVKQLPTHTPAPYDFLPDYCTHPTARTDYNRYQRALDYTRAGFRPSDAVRKAGLDLGRWAATERQAAADALTEERGNSEAVCLVRELETTASEAELALLHGICKGRPADIQKLLQAIRPNEYNVDLLAARREIIDGVLESARRVLPEEHYQALVRELAGLRGPGSGARVAG